MSPTPARWRPALAAVLAGALVVACASDGRQHDPSGDMTGADPDAGAATGGADDDHDDGHDDAAADDATTAEPDVAARDDASVTAEDDDAPAPVELAASPCADLPRTAHPDLDASRHDAPDVDQDVADDLDPGADAELLAAAACLVWFDVLDDAGYAPLEPAGTADAAEVEAILGATRAALDAPGATERVALVAPLGRRELLVEAARMLLADGGDDRLGGGRDGYRSRVLDLPDALRQDARRSTWEEGCPIHLDDLRLLETVIIGFDEVERWGQLVVHHEVAEDVADAFGELYGMGFPIERMEPIEQYGGDDASMAANNTSAFNCRPVTGSSRWSEHSYGWAIDINPVQNPYVRGGTVLPEAGRSYLDRGDVRPGMLTRPGAVEVWDAIGWGWGGDWNTLKDHQHVSLTGR